MLSWRERHRRVGRYDRGALRPETSIYRRQKDVPRLRSSHFLNGANGCPV